MAVHLSPVIGGLLYPVSFAEKTAPANTYAAVQGQGGAPPHPKLSKSDFSGEILHIA